jgi:hypothetical protein
MCRTVIARLTKMMYHGREDDTNQRACQYNMELLKSTGQRDPKGLPATR